MDANLIEVRFTRSGLSEDKADRLLLLRHHSPRWRDSAAGRHRRDREGQPGIPSRRSVGLIEFAVALQIEVSLHVSNGKQKSDLGPNPDHARLEPAENRMLTEIVGDLLIGISDETHEKLLREKLGGTPVDVEVDAVLVLRVLVLEIVGKSRDGRKLVARLRI